MSPVKPDFKICSICKEKKSFSEFAPLKSGKYGIDSKCRQCDIERNRQFNRSEKGVIYEIYRNHKKRIKDQNDTLDYTRDKFYEWLSVQKLFLNLHKVWVDSDYKEDLKPACYKIDADLPYNLENMAIATSKKVIKKYFDDVKNGVSHGIVSKIGKSVLQYTKDGTFVQEFYSMQEAERQTGIPNGAICTVCQGKRKSAGGYIWKYNTNPTEKIKFGEKIKIKHLDNFLFEDIEEILGSEISIDTEKEELVKCRIGQGKFRNQLISYWNGCSVTNFKNVDLLVASHIKPWRSSTNKERLDAFNGLLLTPNLDKLFDKGYISFDDNGKILISKEFKNYKALGISDDMKLTIQKEHKKYLKFHRSDIFQGI